jgi:hypothetical protein
MVPRAAGLVTEPFRGVRGAGDRAYPRTKVYSQNDGRKQEAIILAIYLSGHRPGISIADNRGSRIGRFTASTICAVIRENKPFIGGEKIRCEEIENAPVGSREDHSAMISAREDRPDPVIEPYRIWRGWRAAAASRAAVLRDLIMGCPLTCAAGPAGGTSGLWLGGGAATSTSAGSDGWSAGRG